MFLTPESGLLGQEINEFSPFKHLIFLHVDICVSLTCVFIQIMTILLGIDLRRTCLKTRDLQTAGDCRLKYNVQRKHNPFPSVWLSGNVFNNYSTSQSLKGHKCTNTLLEF